VAKQLIGLSRSKSCLNVRAKRRKVVLMKSMKDALTLRGFVEIIIKDRDGKVLKTMRDHNQVCVGALEAAEKLFSQATTPDDYEFNKMWGIYCGTDNTPAAAADTGLGTLVFAKQCSSISTSVGGTLGLMEAEMTMGNAEGNGNTFCEVGLYTRGNADIPAAPPLINPNALMLARQVHGSIAKTAAIAIVYKWRYQFLTA